MGQVIDVAEYLKKYRIHGPPAPTVLDRDWVLPDPLDLLALADLYGKRDVVSMLGCIYLYTALNHPPDTDAPQSVVLGYEVLKAWLETRHPEVKYRTMDEVKAEIAAADAWDGPI